MCKETHKACNSSRAVLKKSPAAVCGASGLSSGKSARPASFSSSSDLLDTTVYLPLSAYYEGNVIQSKEKLLQKLKNRARAKYVTGLVSVPLSKLASPLQKQYKLAQTCAGNLTETPGKLTGMYCNCRWCLVCSRIRTSKMIAAYLPAIEAMETKFFLTLSRPTVTAGKLLAERKAYIATAQLIGRYLREKLKLKFSFIRKLECTYNEETDLYHPHFHIIIDNEAAARAFYEEWISRSITAKTPREHLLKGNQIKEADNDSAAELFKYFTKVVSKSKTRLNGGFDYRIHLSALDNMFVALKGARTFQAGGIIKTVSEDVEPNQVLDSGRLRVDFWEWLGSDWISRDTGALLSGYEPSLSVQAISDHLVYPPGVALVAAAAPDQVYYVDKMTGEVLPNEFAHLAKDSTSFAKIHPLREKSTPGTAKGGFNELQPAVEPMPVAADNAPLLLPVFRESAPLPAALPPVYAAAVVAVLREAERTRFLPPALSNRSLSTCDRRLTDL